MSQEYEDFRSTLRPIYQELFNEMTGAHTMPTAAEVAETLTNISRADTLERVCDALRSMEPMDGGECLDVLIALLAACDGGSSVQIQECKEAVEIDWKRDCEVMQS